MPRSIVITGCSSGFGRAAALRLVRAGWRVFATVRQDAHAANLSAESGADALLHPVVCDITCAADLARLRSLVQSATERLDALVNNAGTGFPGPLALLPLDDVRAQLEINTVAQLGVTQALLPLLQAARGLLINVSSVGGRVTFPLNGAYHMSKWALEAMSDVLRVELAPFGVKVVVIEPGSSPTAIWDTSLNRAADAGGVRRDWGDYARLASSVERAARAGAAAGFPPEHFAVLLLRILNARRPRPRYVLGADAARLILLRRFLPDALWDWGVRRALGW
jgi:NAD(P)-dependent dehydrogenase (short-subunit alcohol dehydrogenase family)